MLKILLIISALTIFLSGQAQVTTISPIRNGDTLPDLAFRVHIGDRTADIRLSDYKGKLILLDRWSTNCTPCVTSMPHVLKLQKEFKDDIQVIYYTAEKAEKVDQFRHAAYLSDEIKSAVEKLPIIVSDTMLVKLLPGVEFGLQYWIDGSRVFRAMTSGNSASPENIRDFLAGKNAGMDVYEVPEFESFFPEKLNTWLSERIGYQKQLLTYSFLTKYDEKTHVGGSLRTHWETDSVTNNKSALTCLNMMIPDLYMQAYFQSSDARKFHIAWEVKDSSRYYFPKDGITFKEWIRNNGYCYAIKVMPSQTGDLFPMMQKDLDRFFHLESAMGHRNMKCLVLKRTSAKDKLHTKGGPEMCDYVGHEGLINLVLRNIPMDILVATLVGQYGVANNVSSPPFVDATGYTGNIDIDLPYAGLVGSSDRILPLSKMNAFLSKYDLEIVEERRDMEVLIIKDKE